MIYDADGDWDGDDSDRDKDYVPSSSSSETSPKGSDKRSHAQMDVDTDDNSSESHNMGAQETPSSSKTLTRKKFRDESAWKCNVRKTKHDKGQEYVSVRKQLVPARAIKTTKDCQNKCLYKCELHITQQERQTIFSDFYALSANEKRLFILTTTQSFKPERRRRGKTETNSRKGNSYRYFFNIRSQKIQVCKNYYLGTLSISQKPIYNAHAKKTSSNTPHESLQGKHRKRFTKEEDVDLVKTHIESFPKVQSHYCRANTQREYLEATLSIQKMYELYSELTSVQNREPVKFCTYRKIFCNNYNLYFHKPRKDRCDLCEGIKMNHQEGTLISNEKREEYERHMNEKKIMREQMKKDSEEKKAILCFDLENVLTCPRSDVKNFFYKSKLNVYNMTAHLSIKKKVYCAIWSENLSGRAGNDMASAVYKIVDRVLEEHPNLEELTLWSDSCVPQNRNSYMTFAMAHILQKHENLKKLTMKFCVPGHSCIQAVDAVHSCIERLLSAAEYYSPLSLIRLLLKVNKRNPYKIIQMKPQDFMDFHDASSKLNYSKVPFSKICCIELNKVLFQVKYKTSFSEKEFNTANLRNGSLRLDSTLVKLDQILKLKGAKTKLPLPQNKIDAIKTMLPYMPISDQNYYESIIPNITEAKIGKKKKN